MSHFTVDIEADSQSPLTGSMIQIGAVKIDREGEFNKTFFGEMHPITSEYSEDALAAIDMTREETKRIPATPEHTMQQFYDWIYKVNQRGKPVFWADNLAFDWQWINCYFHFFVGENPFGFSGRRIGDLVCGAEKDTFYKWKHLRDTKHTHDPVDDAMGNAEALYKIINRYNIKIKL